MIRSRDCGHSEDTDSLRYHKHPERCYYCWYKAQHSAEYAKAEAFQLQKSNALSERAKKRGLGTLIRNRPLESKARPIELHPTQLRDQPRDIEEPK